MNLGFLRSRTKPTLEKGEKESRSQVEEEVANLGI